MRPNNIFNIYQLYSYKAIRYITICADDTAITLIVLKVMYGSTYEADNWFTANELCLNTRKTRKRYAHIANIHFKLTRAFSI